MELPVSPPLYPPVSAPSAKQRTFRNLPLRVLVRARIRAVFNHMKGLRHESLLKIVVVGVLGLIFWGGLFALFMHVFKFINDVAGPFRHYLAQYLGSFFFLAMMFMLVFSNAVSSFSNLFRSPETAFLFSLPVRHDTIYFYKLIESLLFTSWAVFALGIPVLWAYGIQNQAAWFYYPLLFVYMIPFVIMPAALGGLLGLVLTAVVPRQRGKVLGALAVLVFVPAVYIGIAIFKVPRVHGAYNQDEAGAIFQTFFGYLKFTQHRLTPNYWMAEGLLAISEARTNWVGTGTLFFCALSSTALFCLALGWFISGSIYESTYSYASASSSSKRTSGRTLLEREIVALRHRYPEIMILLVKDIKTFMRDPAQWSQVVIFFGILMLYVGNLRNFSYNLEEPFYKHLISFLNLSATCMTLATLTSRFIFPLISLEGPRFWILGLVPLKRSNIILSKFYFALSGALVLTISLTLMSNYMLRNTSYVLVVQLLVAVFISIGLSGLSVGMGAIFPSFGERNPSRIVSGFGGTLTLIIALILVSFTLAGEALLCHRQLVMKITDSNALDIQYGWSFTIVIAGLAVLNILAAAVPLKLGIRLLERFEF